MFQDIFNSRGHLWPSKLCNFTQFTQIVKFFYKFVPTKKTLFSSMQVCNRFVTRFLSQSLPICGKVYVFYCINTPKFRPLIAQSFQFLCILWHDKFRISPCNVIPFSVWLHRIPSFSLDIFRHHFLLHFLHVLLNLRTKAL